MQQLCTVQPNWSKSQLQTAAAAATVLSQLATPATTALMEAEVWQNYGPWTNCKATQTTQKAGIGSQTKNTLYN
jgi:hypothetical protein